jgi:hypothetical protein
MSPSAQPTAPADPLPEALRRFFWDTDFDRLRWPRDREAIIARILASGNWEATRWLRAQIGDEELGRWIEKRRGRGLPAARLRFWELIAELDPAQVDAWLAEREEEPWTRRHAWT